MDYLIDGRIKIDRDPEHKSLYAWSLNEIDANGNVREGNQIPWPWSFFFIGSLLQVVRNISFGNIYNDEGEKIEGKFVSQGDTIVGQLHSGRCADGLNLLDTTTFTMFGSSRKIDCFRLEIRTVESENDETCRIEGIPSYSYEQDFSDEVEPDYIGVMFYLTRKRFEEIANLIEKRTFDHAAVRLSGVSGIYSSWSPIISTPKAKILTRGHLQFIDGDDEFKSGLPIIGNIEEFSINLIVNNKLNVKIDQSPVLIDKCFDDEAVNFNDEENSKHKIDNIEKNSFAEEIGGHLVVQINELQKAITKINVAIWILVVILIIQALN